jgi:DNA invertase Pin-like site-specific DNA recombinase
MIYGYIRVSTDKQSVENQKFEILNFVNQKKLVINEWVEEVESGGRKASERKLGKLLKDIKKGETLIVSEISRLGRSLLDVMSTLNELMNKDCSLFSIKENLELGGDKNNITSKVLAFAFSLSSEIERQLISQRTRESLARKKAMGQSLGRPKGYKLKNKKLSGKEEEISHLLTHGVSARAISRLLNVHHSTVLSFAKEKSLLP